MGRLTGTPADPLNEVAVKEMLWDLTKILPTVDLYSFWKFAAHLRPHFTDDAMRHQFSGSSLLLGTQMAQDSDTVDVVAGFITKDPMRVRDLLAVTIPDAMRDAYGPEIPLGALTFVREFVESDPYGSQLDVRGTTAVGKRFVLIGAARLLITHLRLLQSRVIALQGIRQAWKYFL